MLAAIAVLAGPAEAHKRHRSKAPSGIEGAVLNTTCPGACPATAPPSPAYTGSGLIVTVSRVSDGAVIGTQEPSDGQFRFRLKRGLYRVSAAIAEPTPTPGPTPMSTGPTVMPIRCWQGDSQEARVHRHRFTHVELHVGNVCIV